MEARTFTHREEDILERVVEIIKRYLDPGKIILFGSRGKGTPYRNSDFDFAIDREKPEKRIERTISEEIDQIAGLYHVDIVYLPSADEDFRSLILQTGKVIYEK